MFGISRQAYYKRHHKVYANNRQNLQALHLVSQHRKEQGRIGTRKLYLMIKPELNAIDIKMGRDKLFTILRDNKMLVKKKKNFHKTTDSNHHFRKHPNLIKGMRVTKPEQVWVSDITYIKTEAGHEYLSLVTDMYSKRIMGYHLSDSLKTEGTLQALKMAIKSRKYPGRKLIHHSDRGFQYCSDAYTNMVEANGIKISMTQSYDPYENAVAERVNGILKDEFEIGDGFVNHLQAVKEIKRSIETYNSKRLHTSCEMMTPDQAHRLGRYQLKSWSRLSTNKQILTKEKSTKKENITTTNINFN